MTIRLPTTATAYVRAVSSNDPSGFIGPFAEDAVVDDGRQVFRGREAIQEWATSDIFAVNVSLEVLDAGGTERDARISTRVAGTFNRTGLPDPVVITHRVTSAGGQITGLTCRLTGT